MLRRNEILLDIRVLPSEIVYYRWVQVLKEVLLIYHGKVRKCLPRNDRHDLRVGILDSRETSGWRDLVPWAQISETGGKEWHRIFETLDRKWSGVPIPWIDPKFQPDWQLVLDRANREGVTHISIWTNDDLDIMGGYTFSAHCQVVSCPIDSAFSTSLSQLARTGWGGENPLAGEAIRKAMLTFFCREDAIECQLTLPPSSGSSGKPSLVIRGLLNERHLNPLMLSFDMCLSMAEVSVKTRVKQSIFRLEAFKLVKQSGVCQSLITSARTLILTNANESSPEDFVTLCQFLEREDTALLARSRAKPGVFALFPAMGRALILKALATRDLLVELPKTSGELEFEPNIQVESALNQLELELYYDPSVHESGMIQLLELEELQRSKRIPRSGQGIEAGQAKRKSKILKQPVASIQH